MKFGGTSVADPERIKRAARRIVERREAGAGVVAVLSARGKTTDELIAMAQEVSEAPDAREMDMLLSTGERISCALCAMAIKDLGHRAISLTGSQAGIVTDTSHTSRAHTRCPRGARPRGAGGGPHRAGRRLPGGLDHDPGRHDAGPWRVGHHRGRGRRGAGCGRLRNLHRRGGRVQRGPTDRFRRTPAEEVSFEEMLEMAASGAGVLQLRSVEYARNHGVRIHCRSSFEDRPGTVVVSEGENMDHSEKPLITAVTHSTSEAMITLLGVRHRPGVAASIFEALAEAAVDVDMIDQNGPTSGGGLAEISFTVPREHLRAARAALEPLAGEAVLGADRPRGDRQGLDRRRRHALAPGGRREGVQGARRRGSQHRHDLDLADQDLLRHPSRPRRAGGAGAARRLRALRAGHDPRGVALGVSPFSRAERPRFTLNLMLFVRKLLPGFSQRTPF